MTKYRLKLPIQIGDKILYFESPPLDKKESDEFSSDISKRIGKELVGNAVIIDKYTEASMSIAP